MGYSSAQGENALGSIGRILIVDDDDDVRVVTALCARRVAGWEVDEAATGPEALEKATREPPDLILLDVTMPEMDGPSVLAALRAREATASVPVIFVTGRLRPDEIERFLGLGAAGVISKPYDPLTLPEQIAGILGAAEAM